MRALRYVYLLALAAWLGGFLAVGAVAAPAIFDVLQAHEPASGRALAGAVAGEVVRRFHVVAYAADAVLLASLAAMGTRRPRPRALGIRVGIVVAMLVPTLYSGVVVRGQIDRLQAEIGASPATLPPSDPGRIRFGRLHGLSTALLLIGLAGGLTLVYWETES